MQRKLVPLFEIVQIDAYRNSFHDSYVVFSSVDAGWEYLNAQSKARNLNPDEMPERYWTFKYLGETAITYFDFEKYVLDDIKEACHWEQFPDCMVLPHIDESSNYLQNELAREARNKAVPKLQRLKFNIELSKDRDPIWCKKALHIINETISEKSAFWWSIVGKELEFNMQWLHREVNDM